MKKKASWLLIPAVAMGLGACGKKEEAKAPDAPSTIVDKVVEEVKDVITPAPAVPKIGVDERAAKLGFAKHLPQDTEVVLAFYNGTKTAERFKNTKIWKLVQEQMGMGGMMPGDFGDEVAPPAEQDAGDPDAAEDADAAVAPGAEPMDPSALFGTEFTLAMGKSTGEQAGNLFKAYSRINYFQMRNMARSFAKMASSGDSDGMQEAMGNPFSPELMKDFVKDPQSGIAAIEKAQMPPIYMAFRTEEAQRASASMEIASMVENMAMFGPMVEPVKIDVAGATFEGMKVSGAKVSESMAEDREQMEEQLDAATVDKLIAAMAKKDLVVVSGTVGDYVILFIGSSTDALKLAATPAESLVGSDALAFSDAYASKDLAVLSYGQKESMEVLVKSVGGMSDMTNGIRDGLAGAEGLGDTRDLEALFQIVAERETALRKLAGMESSGMVAFFEEGLKIESFGGADYGMVDWKATNRLSHLGDSEDVLMFADVTSGAEYSEKSRAYLEALMETGYAMAMKATELPLKGADMEQFKGMAKMIDEKFRPDMVSLWSAFGKMTNSLGKESAMVIDLKGAAPAIPGIPQEVVDAAKVPRISFISPVTDRAQLAGSWDQMNTTITGTLAKISEMTGQEIPMQKPLSSDKNGATTWFFPMPFFTDDFLPSVTVSDKWFVTSTSKLQAIDLIGQAEAAKDGIPGVTFSMNFKTLQKYADETLNVIADNAKAITGSEMSASDKKQAKDVIAALGDLDKLTAYSRREGSVLRTSVHLKTR